MQRSLLSTAPRIVATPENPAHIQIERWLIDALEQWVVRPGERLPGGRVLSDALGVSRMTLRQPMNVLEQRGMIRPSPAGEAGPSSRNSPSM